MFLSAESDFEIHFPPSPTVFRQFQILFCNFLPFSIEIWDYDPPVSQNWMTWAKTVVIFGLITTKMCKKKDIKVSNGTDTHPHSCVMMILLSPIFFSSAHKTTDRLRLA